MAMSVSNNFFPSFAISNLHTLNSIDVQKHTVTFLAADIWDSVATSMNSVLKVLLRMGCWATCISNIFVYICLYVCMH